MVYTLSMASMWVFTYTLNLGHIGIVYATAALLGYEFPFSVYFFNNRKMILKNIFFRFFMTGYLPIGYEYAAELTFPEPEGTSSGFLNMSIFVFGYGLTMAASTILDMYGDKYANILMACMLCLGTVLTVAIRGELRRYTSQKSQKVYQSVVYSVTTK